MKAINDYESITARWNDRDPAVTAQMWGKASEVQEAAKGRLGELLSYHPQYITTVLRENKSDLDALKNQKDDVRAASADTKRENGTMRLSAKKQSEQLKQPCPPAPSAIP